MNHSQWEENTLQEVEEQVIFINTSQTPKPKEKHNKRIREEEYSPVIETRSKDFLIYKKK